MNWWRSFLDTLDTPGGHILILLALVWVGVAMTVRGWPKGEDILIGAFGAMLALLRGTVKANGGETKK